MRFIVHTAEYLAMPFECFSSSRLYVVVHLFQGMGIQLPNAVDKRARNVSEMNVAGPRLCSGQSRINPFSVLRDQLLLCKDEVTVNPLW